MRLEVGDVVSHLLCLSVTLLLQLTGQQLRLLLVLALQVGTGLRQRCRGCKHTESTWGRGEGATDASHCVFV